MSIERLEMIEKCIRKGQAKYSYDYLLEFIQQTIITFKDQSDQIADLRKQIAETLIDYNKIKIGGTD